MINDQCQETVLSFGTNNIICCICGTNKDTRTLNVDLDRQYPLNQDMELQEKLHENKVKKVA